MYSVDENEIKKITDNVGQLFKGYPSDIKRYIEKISLNGTNKNKNNKINGV